MIIIAINSLQQPHPPTGDFLCLDELIQNIKEDPRLTSDGLKKRRNWRGSRYATRGASDASSMARKEGPRVEDILIEGVDLTMDDRAETRGKRRTKKLEET